MKENDIMLQQFDPEELLGPLNETEKRRCPRLLFVAGDAGLFSDHPKVSIVGSRKASSIGIKRAEKISRLLSQNGVVVVSGLAEGIDTAAHTAAIQAGGRTIAVLGTPLDKTYPKSNLELQREIIEHHAAVSQFPIGQPVQPKNFIMRNGTMALIVCASVIVEAGDTSGALSQGWEALRMGRLLFIMDSVFSNKNLKWPNEMLRYGAQVLSDENFESFLDVLPHGKMSEHALAI
jgi:DNA processing protein